MKQEAGESGRIRRSVIPIFWLGSGNEKLNPVTNQTILVSTWGNGVFAITGDEHTQELEEQPVRGLTPDGCGGALAIVADHSLCRRLARGVWETIATSKYDLSCCVSVGETVYVGTEDARMLRLSEGSAELEPIDSFDRVPGRDTWFAGSMMVNGQRMGPPLGVRSVAANSDGSVLYANVHVGGIPRSLDDGANWQPTIDIHSDVHEVCAHPSDTRVVIAASAVGLGISRDSGATWTIESAGLHATHCLAVAFSGNDILVSAATDPFAEQGRFYRRPLRSDGPLVAVESGMPPWTDGSVDTGCIATNGASIAVVDKGGNVYGSDDYGQSWSRWSNGLRAPSGVVLLEAI